MGDTPIMSLKDSDENFELFVISEREPLKLFSHK